MRYYEETIMILTLMQDLVPKLDNSDTAKTTHNRDFDKTNLFIKPNWYQNSPDSQTSLPSIPVP